MKTNYEITTKEENSIIDFVQGLNEKIGKSVGKSRFNIYVNRIFSILIFCALFIPTFSIAQVVLPITASGTWTVPAGVTSVTVYTWGGGGGGGGSSPGTWFGNGGGGGGGAMASSVLTVVPGQVYTVTVGAGGAGATSGSTLAGIGGTTTFTGTGGTVAAVGGGRGTSSTAVAGATLAGGAGGTAAASTGTTKFSGGTGSSGRNGTSSTTGRTGTGGGGAGSGSDGVSPVTGTCASPGTGGSGTYPGGLGGRNLNCNTTTSSAGVAGAVFGGGGSGANCWTGTWAGGAGGAGRIILVYTPQVYCTTPSSPANLATGVAQNATISWAAEVNATSYDVYFGTDPGATNILNGANQAGTSYIPAILSPSTTYYWRIVPKSSGSTATGCTTWSFTTVAAVPTISAGSLTAFGNVCVGSVGGPNSFSVSGFNLTGNVNIAASSGYTYCLTAGGTYTPTLSIPASGTLASTLVYVKFSPTAAITYNTNIVVSSASATSQNVTPSGTGLALPVLNPITGTTSLCIGSTTTLGGNAPTVQLQSFTTVGVSSFTPSFTGNAEVLVVAGGGAGGTNRGGGGGAGGVIYNSAVAVTAGTPVSVTVGAGGIGSATAGSGTNGGNSIFGAITATGGGRGGSHITFNTGANGGSGGGAGLSYATNTFAGGTGIAGQGFAGGGTQSAADATRNTAGGGGAGGAAVTTGTSTATPPNGGVGISNSITGSPVFYGGGGGGANANAFGEAYSTAGTGTGGNGGGGNGAPIGGNPTNGAANTGGGGGGGGSGGSSTMIGGNGGSGIVVVKLSTFTYAWSSSNTAVATVNPITGVVTGVSVGTAIITYTATSYGCSSSVTTTVTVTAADIVTATSSVSGNLCLGASANIGVTQTGSNGNVYTFAWTMTSYTNSGLSGSVSASVGTPIAVTPTAVGSYVYTINASSAGCSPTSSVTINVINPTAGITTTPSATPANVCVGSSTSLDVVIGSTTPPTYTAPPAVSTPLGDEDFGNITITQGASTILNNTTPGGSLVGSIGTATGTGGSYSDFTAFGPYTLVTGLSYNLSVTSITQGGSYGNSLAVYIDYNRNGVFTDAGENVYNQGATIVGPHTSTGSFVVPAGVSFGYARMRVSVNEGTITSPTQTFTWGEYEEYMINLQPNITSYSWSNGVSSIASTKVASAVVAANTTYTSSVFIGGCPINNSISVTSVPIPTAPTTTPSPQCGPGVPTCSAAGGTAGQYRWYTVATGGTALAGETGSTLSTYSISAATTFYVAINNGTCESTRTPVAVSYSTALPATPGTISGTAIQCPALSTQTYSITAISGANSYTWTVPTGWTITAGATTNSITVTTGASAQNGNISVTATNFCGTTPASTLAVTVASIPACISTFSPADGATNQSALGVVISWSAVPEATAYDVYLDGVLVSADQVGTSYTLSSVAVSTTYTWKVVPKNCAGAPSACSTYSFTTASSTCTPPSFTLAPTNILCIGGTTGSIAVSASGGVSPYFYSIDNGLNYVTTTTFSGLSQGTYNIIVKGTDDCVSLPSPITLTQPATAVSATASGAASGCNGTVVPLTGSGSGGTGTLTYSWTPTIGLSNAAIASPSVTITGTQAYVLQVTDANGCSASATAVNITSNTPAAPTSTATPPVICVGQSTNLNAVSTGNLISWWDAPTGGNQLATNLASATNYAVSPVANTTYYAQSFTATVGTPTTQTFNYTGAITTWTVPAGVSSITVNAKGASGGFTSGSTPGKGAVLTGTFAVSPGQVLSVLVGQSPGLTTLYPAGGGGTFVALGSSFATATPMIVAGGGGAAYSSMTATNADPNSTSGQGANPGTAGNGAPAQSCAGGGGGFFTSGGNDALYGFTGGAGFRQGGAGGIPTATYAATYQSGGFGGGAPGNYVGSCNTFSGSGGGYSGGSAQGTGTIYVGNFGGSFNSGTATTVDLAGNTGNGQITISYTPIFPGCTSSTRTAVAVNVGTYPTITAQPTTPSAICGTGSATVSVTATSATSYQWFKGGVALADGSTYSGVNTNTMTITSPALSENGGVLTCVITGGSTCTVTSNTVTLSVNSTPADATSVTATPGTICVGDIAQLSAVSAGNSINWWTAATGGTLVTSGVASGANFGVSPISTTTYYAEATTSITVAGTQTFNFTGAVQPWTVPNGVTSINVDMSGAQGGNQSAAGSTGGLGGRLQATYPVTAGQVLNIYVGGASTSTTGGFNGGGTGPTSTPANGGGGGGASDIRIGGVALTDRVLVAGGGGGAGLNCSTNQEGGGTGGGLTGGTGFQCNVQTTYPGTGGTQSAGGATGTLTPGTPGVIGVGGNGSVSYGGGGGGGYYGGGGGAYGGGGGGSSFANGSATSVTHTQGFKTGNGQVVISYNGVIPLCPSTSRVPVTVNVNPLPTITAQPAATVQQVCLNAVPTDLSVSATAGSGTITTYEWYSNATASNVGGTLVATNTSSALTNTYTPITTTLGTLYYYAIVVNSNGCRFRSAVSGAVTVNPNPTAVTAASSLGTICDGATVNLTSSSTSNFTSLQTLLSPTGDGGFETGTTFPANGWTIVNDGNNKWYVGTADANSGTRGAYISTNASAGAANSYNVNNANIGHFYRDVVIPAGATNITLSFNWKGLAESCCDYIQVSMVPTTTTPVAAALLGTGQLGVNLNNQSTWQTISFPLSNALAGTTQRLVFTWRNDGSVGTAPAGAIDNVSITAIVPQASTYAWTANPAGFTSAVQNPTAVAPTANTTYTVEATNGFNCKATNTVAVVVNPRPTSTFTSTSTNICYGNSFALAGNITASGAWTMTLSPSGTVTGTGSGTWTSTVAPTATTTYSVTNIVDALGCPVGTMTGSNTLTLPTVTAALSPTDNATCIVKGTNWTHFYTSAGKLVVSIKANNPTDDLGSVTASSFVSSDAQITTACADPAGTTFQTAVLGRNWYINPTNNLPATIRLPITNAEVTALIAKSATTSVNPNDDVFSISNINLSKYNGLNENGSWQDNCNPADGSSYATSNMYITQGANGAISIANGFIETIAGSSYIEFTIPGFSEFWLMNSGNASPLPVQLTNFAATCNDKAVELKWTTASELNSQSFIVERSRDLDQWEYVSTLNAAGNSNYSINYQTVDNDPFSGTSYYRLVQVDLNGAEKIYGPISVSCANESNGMVVFPNPTKGNFTVEITTDEDLSDSQLVITDLSGKVISTRSIHILQGTTQAIFENQDLQLGTYIIQLNSSNHNIQPVRVVVN